MFKEDDIVKYNGQYRVVEQVSPFKDFMGDSFSFAPVRLVKKATLSDLFCIVLGNMPHVLRNIGVFDIAIKKLLIKNNNCISVNSLKR